MTFCFAVAIVVVGIPMVLLKNSSSYLTFIISPREIWMIVQPKLYMLENGLSYCLWKLCALLNLSYWIICMKAWWHFSIVWSAPQTSKIGFDYAVKFKFQAWIEYVGLRVFRYVQIRALSKVIFESFPCFQIAFEVSLLESIDFIFNMMESRRWEGFQIEFLHNVIPWNVALRN